MTAYEPINGASRELLEIDMLLRALRDLRHWSATAAVRQHYGDDQGRRLYATAAVQRDTAWADSLHAAHGLFEIDAIHRAWIDAGGVAE